jgi:hypothetical protein
MHLLLAPHAGFNSILLPWYLSEGRPNRASSDYESRFPQEKWPWGFSSQSQALISMLSIFAVIVW